MILTAAESNRYCTGEPRLTPPLLCITNPSNLVAKRMPERPVTSSKRLRHVRLITRCARTASSVAP